MSVAEPAGATGSRVLRRGLRVLAIAIRTKPWPFAVAVLGATVYGTMTVASAQVFGAVTDRVILPAFAAGRTSAAALAAAAGALVAVAALKMLGMIVRRLGATYMQVRLQAVFRGAVTRQYQRLPLSWHRRHSTGSLLSNANADVEAAFRPIAPLPFSVGVVLMLVITAVLLIVTDPVLAAVGLLVGPALVGLNWRYNRLTERPAMLAQQHRADVSAVAHESFDGALVVKTLGLEFAETRRFEAESERLRDQLVHYGRLRALYDPMMEALPTVGVLALLMVGAYRLAAGHLSEGDLVSFAYLFTLLAFPIRAIGWVLSDLPGSVVGWDRVEAVLVADGTQTHGSREGPRQSGPATAEMAQVTFGYDTDDASSAAALHEVTFTAPAGRIVAVVGPTGAGKSTIASLLVRLEDPDDGLVRLDGDDVRALRPGALARQAAIVFQHTFLFDDTVRRNITLGDDFSDEQVHHACRLAAADEFIRDLPHGYDTVVGERGTSLSGGQRQRVALARALVRRPRLLILDDATSSVDTAVEAAILHNLREAALPSTIVVVAHRQATIAMADHIVFVQHGRVRAAGSHAELLGSVPAYARLLTAYADQARLRAHQLVAAASDGDVAQRAG